jgi:hypothetical protein
VPSPCSSSLSGGRFYTRCPRSLGEVSPNQEPPWHQEPPVSLPNPPEKLRELQFRGSEKRREFDGE